MLTIFGVDARRISWKYAISSGRYRTPHWTTCHRRARVYTNSNNNLTSDDDILSRARRTVCQNVRPSVYITFFCLVTATDGVLFKNKYCVFPLGSFVPHYIHTSSPPARFSSSRHHRFGHYRVLWVRISYIQARTHRGLYIFIFDTSEYPTSSRYLYTII